MSGSEGRGVAPPAPEKHVFILSGQSNMAGRGGVSNETKTWDGVVPDECAPSPSILRFSAAQRWEEAREPPHCDIDAAKVCGIGPGMALAHAILAGSRPNLVVALDCL